MHPKPKGPAASPDRVAAVLVTAFVCLLAVFPIRNNDIWWHLAVGRELVQSGRFIVTDPFTFTLAGTPWVPHAWLSGLLFYAIHAWSAELGLLALRAAIVVTIFVLLLRLVRRLGVSLVLAAPVVLVAALNVQARFILRPHLFEYLLILLMLGALLSAGERRGARFFLVPVVLQLLWVNLHPSFYLGVGMAVLFFAGEWLSSRLSAKLPVRGFLAGAAIDWRRVGLLIVLLAAASFVNPSPVEFVTQPLNAEHRQLLTAYTLEWLSPFDAAMTRAAFHPYYELLLAFAAAAFLLSWRRLRLSSLLIVGLFAGLSLTAHRFRVEFALVAVPLALDQLRISPLTERIRKRLARKGRMRFAPHVACVLAALALMVTARDRVIIEGAVSGRFPQAAFDFVRDNDIARRPFHGIAHGSYLVWELYPERKAFIDGRNIDAALYREFLACQTTTAAFNTTINKYDLDGFILPSPELSDGGMRRTHDFLIQSKGWSLVYMDRNAYVYVKRNKVPQEWLERHRYGLYHPVTFARLRFAAEHIDALRGEIERASATDPRYARPLLDLASLHASLGERDRALDAIERVLAIDAANAEARAMKRTIASRS
ncbi:MAG: hypothetical protein V3V49_09635 [Candidatus Krumholzibacteria bacterium]